MYLIHLVRGRFRIVKCKSLKLGVRRKTIVAKNIFPFSLFVALYNCSISYVRSLLKSLIRFFTLIRKRKTDVLKADRIISRLKSKRAGFSRNFGCTDHYYSIIANPIIPVRSLLPCT
jgi:hypothetical protein